MENWAEPLPAVPVMLPVIVVAVAPGLVTQGESNKLLRNRRTPLVIGFAEIGSVVE